MSLVMYPDHYEKAIQYRIRNNATKTFIKTFGEERVNNVLGFLQGEVSKAQPFPLWVSFIEGYHKYGKLSEKQLVCVENAIAKRAARKAEKEAEIAQNTAKSEFVGQIGEKLTLELTVKAVTTYDRRGFSYYDRGYTIVYIMADSNDNIIIYKATTGRADYKNGNEVERGDIVKVTATVKNHAEYKGVKQTTIQRPKWELVVRPAGQIDDKVEEIGDEYY